MVYCMQSGRVIHTSAGPIATLTLDNDEGRGSLTRGMIDQLCDHLDELDADDGVRAVVLTSTGRYFCTGTTLERGRALGAPREGVRKPARDGGGVLSLRLFDFSKPVIAAINGDAAGVGASILLPCDVRIATPEARIGFVQARRGIALEGCASWFLPRLVGIARAMEWAVSGRLVSMPEARDAGLVQAVHPREELLAAAIELATEMTRDSAPVSAALTRRMLWNSLTLSSPMEAHRIETDVVRTLGTMPDAREGVASFFERRSPAFTDLPSAELSRFTHWWSSEPFDPQPSTERHHP